MNKIHALNAVQARFYEPLRQFSFLVRLSFFRSLLFHSFFLFFALSSLAMAQTEMPKAGINTVRVSGVVKDQGGERIPFASVSVKGTKLGTRTNAEGLFTVMGLPDSACTLVVQHLGYKQAVLDVNPRTTKMQNLVVTMLSADIKTKRVEVTAEQETFVKAEKTPSLTTISPKQFQSLPSIGQPDVFRSLQLLPGISGTNDGTSGLFVRGGTPDQNLVLFDGMTIYHVDHFFGFFSAFNPDAVKDVQFYKGGFPAMYGGRLSSVVELTGKTGRSDGIHGSINANLISLSGTIEAPITDKGNLLVAFRRSYKLFSYDALSKAITDQQQSSRTLGGGTGRGLPAFIAQSTPDSYFYDLNAKFTYNITPRDILSVSWFSSSDEIDNSLDFSNIQLPAGFPGAGSGRFNPANLPKITDKNLQGNLGASAKWFHSWDNVEGLYTTVVGSFSQYSSSYVFKNERASTDANQPRIGSNEQNLTYDASLRIDNEWQIEQNHQLKFGLQSSMLGSSYSRLFSTPFRSTADTFRVNDEGLQTSLYAQDTWQALPNLDITGGLRLSHYTITGQAYLEPRASIRYEISPEFAVKGAVGRYYQYVNRIVNENLTEGSRDFWKLSDAVLTPSSANHFIAGFTLQNGGWLLDVEAYYKQLYDVVEFSQRLRRNADEQYSFFKGNGSARGLEVLLQKKTGWLTGWISYTLSRTESYFPEINANPFPAAQDQTHELKAILSADLGDDWKLSSTFIYGSGRPFTAPVSQYTLGLLGDMSESYVHVGEKNGNRLPAFHRLDVSLTKKISEPGEALQMLAGLSVFNVYNRKNVSYYRYDFSTSPVLITEVTSLGITPTLFVQIEF